MSEAFEEYMHRQRKWSERTFGPGLRTRGITNHIRKELAEVEAAPRDLGEWIDVITLAMDGYWRAGGKAEHLLPMLFGKQDVNRARKWPRPKSQDEAAEHVKEPALFTIGHCKRCLRGRKLNSAGYCALCSGEER